MALGTWRRKLAKPTTSFHFLLIFFFVLDKGGNRIFIFSFSFFLKKPLETRCRQLHLLPLTIIRVGNLILASIRWARFLSLIRFRNDYFRPSIAFRNWNLLQFLSIRNCLFKVTGTLEGELVFSGFDWGGLCCDLRIVWNLTVIQLWCD